MDKTLDFPVLPVRNTVIFPGISVPLIVGRPGSLAALKRARNADNQVLILAQHENSQGDPSERELYRVGTIAKVENALGSESKGYQIVVRGISRFKVSEL